MKFYRVDYYTEGGSSAGFKWHTNARDAATEARQLWKDDPEAGRKPEITRVLITPSKEGILKALRFLASHPDNG